MQCVETDVDVEGEGEGHNPNVWWMYVDAGAAGVCLSVGRHTVCKQVGAAIIVCPV